MPPIATNTYENIKSANNNFGNSEFSRYQQSANTNNTNNINDYDYLNNGTNNPNNNSNNNSLNEFSKYRAPIIENSYPSYEYNYNSNKEKNSFDAKTHEGSNNFTFDPITNFNSQAATTAPVNLTSSWLHGNDFSMTAGDLFGTTRNENLGNFSGVNFDQIKIGDQTMENVLKALDPKIKNSSSNDFFSNNLNGLNLDSSFNTKKFSNHDFNTKTNTRYNENISNNNNNNNNNFDYFKPTNRSNIIKSHNAAKQQNNKFNFQKSTTATTQFFSNPDESFVNMTLPAVDASMIFSSDKPIKGPNFKTKGYSNNKNAYNNNDAHNNTNAYNNNNAHNNTNTYNNEKEQFVSFAVQQYRMLASMNPEMMQAPENIEELSDRETFKYWGKLFVEDRERQARIILNMQKALTEALSASAGKGPNVLSHLGAATGDLELENIGRYADQCRKRSQMISNFFQRKRM